MSMEKVHNPLDRAYRLGVEMDGMIGELAAADPDLAEAYRDLLFRQPIDLDITTAFVPGYNVYILSGKSPLRLDPERVKAWNERDLPWVSTGEEGSEVGISYLIPGDPDPDNLGSEVREFLHIAFWDFAVLAHRAYTWFLEGELLGPPIPRNPFWPEYQGERVRLEREPHPHLVFANVWIGAPPVTLRFPGGTRFLLPSALPQGVDPLTYLREAEETAWALFHDYYRKALREGKVAHFGVEKATDSEENL